MQAGNITTNLKVKIYFTLPQISATKTATWNFHVDDYARGRYDIILGRCLLTQLGLNLRLSYHVIKSYDRTLKGTTGSMVDLGMYECKYLNIGKITPDESFKNYYLEEIHRLEQVRTYTKWLRVIFDAEHETEDLNKVIKKQCQNLIEKQRNELLRLLQNFEYFFDGTIGTWKKYPVDFELK